MISRLIRKLQHRLSCIAGWTENMEEKKYKAIIEGILFSMGESVELEKIAGTLGLDQKKTKDLIDEMRNEWEEQKRGVTITELDGAYQMCTRPEIYEYLIKIAKQPKRRVLTDVLLETLSIIAYKQPVTKMEIEKIRGVSSDHAVNKLVEYHLVCELGRLDAPGRPLLFGTTEEFLRSFGVHSIDDLPVLSPVQVEEFKQEAEEEKLAAKEAAAEKPAKEVGFIAVSVGEGLTDIFEGLGVDYLIEGGQTMNPSTEDMLNAIEQVNAKNIFILPNNKNIILAAEQARDLTEDKKIIVLPTKTIPQGISAMIGYMPEAGVDENEENMKEAYQDIASGQVTYAVRDTVIDGKEIHNGDIMGINDDGIAAVGKNLTETTLELLSTMADEDSELICLYYGADVTKDDADTLSDAIEDKFPECEVEVNFGGQPIYYYMISVE